MADDTTDVERLMRFTGLTIRAAGPLLGSGPVVPVALRFLRLDPSQKKRYRPNKLSVIKRVTFWVDKAVITAEAWPNLDPSLNHFWDVVMAVARDDKSFDAEIVLKTQLNLKRGAIDRIIDRYRVARLNFVREHPNFKTIDVWAAIQKDRRLRKLQATEALPEANPNGKTSKFKEQAILNKHYTEAVNKRDFWQGKAEEARIKCEALEEEVRSLKQRR
ncbi:hypothetical protein Cob_v002024 [Colletotrichum orbiculare MAFF 240422]|uniref:Uncharacterized protein n=1 Tax=Colletotrichum orbiculare (strain 104-T / ATCC 96160 / CBS 514.97 / LARS 414 / MAFF 240422) TaxID=1213857 RepID=N4V9S9_COLOR|nr:hypothetical protein Cob_v002024 [Colletotrichum orbiculare MAFF 240422]